MTQVLYSYGEDEIHAPGAEERTLLAAHLELACRDLLTGSSSEIKCALKWFKGIDSEGYREQCITYKMVLEYLELSSQQLIKIQHFISVGITRRNKIVKGQFSRTKKGLFCNSALHGSRRPRCC